MNAKNEISRTLLTKIAVIVVEFLWYGSLLGMLMYTLVVTLPIPEFGWDEESKIVGISLNINYFDSNDLSPGSGETIIDNSKALVRYISGVAMLQVPDEVGTWRMLIAEAAGFIFLIVTYTLRKIVRAARDGKPFTFDNVRRVRLIGLLLMVNGFVNSMVQYVISRSYLDYVVVSGAKVSARMDYFTSINFLLLGLLVLVLAQVFDMGVRLQADNDLTV